MQGTATERQTQERVGKVYNQSLHDLYCTDYRNYKLKKSVNATFWSYWLCKALRSPLLASETFIQHEGETLGLHTQVKHFVLL